MPSAGLEMGRFGVTVVSMLAKQVLRNTVEKFLLGGTPGSNILAIFFKEMNSKTDLGDLFGCL